MNRIRVGRDRWARRALRRPAQRSGLTWFKFPERGHMAKEAFHEPLGSDRPTSRRAALSIWPGSLGLTPRGLPRERAATGDRSRSGRFMVPMRANSSVRAFHEPSFTNGAQASAGFIMMEELHVSNWSV